MNLHGNITAVGPDTDPAQFSAMVEANTTAVQKNNEGNIALRQGQFDRAAALHREALELKLRAFGEESVQAAMSFNALGYTYLKMGPSQLDLAEENLRKALRVRNDRAFGGLEMGPRIDAAVSRDNVARLLEARGKMGEARDMRLKGSPKGEILCGSDKCIVTDGAMMSLDKAQGCGACKAVFYCSRACQKQDWVSRHKPLCKAYAATKTPAEGTTIATPS